MKKIIFLWLFIIFGSFVSASVISPLTLVSLGSGDIIPVGSSTNVAGNNIKLVSIGDDDSGRYVNLEINNLPFKVYEKELFAQNDFEIYIIRIVKNPALDYINWYIASNVQKDPLDRNWFYNAKAGDVIKLNSGDIITVKTVDLNEFKLKFNDKEFVLNSGGSVTVNNFKLYLETIKVNDLKKSGLLIISYIGNDRIQEKIQKENVLIKPNECEGCFVEGKCLKKGNKNQFFYCTTDKKLNLLKLPSDECSFDFECENNRCAEGLCFKEVVKEQTFKGYYFKFKNWFWNKIGKLNL